jgi:signal transduction histidine kinase
LDLFAGDIIMPVMRDAQVVTLAGIRVVDTQGIVVATTGSELGQSILHRQEVSRALKGEHVSLLRQRISDQPQPPLVSISRGANLRVFVAMPIYMVNRIVGAVVLSRTPRDLAHALYGKRYVLLKGTLVLFCVVILLTIFTSWAINSPMKKLIIQSQRAIRGEKGAVKALAKPVTKEVEQLSHAIAQMAATLEHRADYFQNFAALVSHAFKTPLTAIQGAVEILQDHFDDMAPEKRRKFLSNIAEDSQRLDALVRKLFDLAKADTVQIGSHSTNLTERLEKLVHAHAVSSMNIRLKATGAYSINMDATLFDSIVNTILENATQQSATDMEIRMDRDEHNNVNICFRDNGPGISAANVPRIFEPFFTTRPNQGGTGLGLAVAKRLAIAHGGDLTLQGNPEHKGSASGGFSPKGAVFCLSLPISHFNENSKDH